VYAVYPLPYARVSIALGRRIRWMLAFLLVVGWFVALAMNIGGNGVHLLLAAAVVVLLYELIALDTPS
jgi:hypothetical protein